MLIQLDPQRASLFLSPPFQDNVGRFDFCLLLVFFIYILLVVVNLKQKMLSIEFVLNLAAGTVIH